jgi:radical SAM superfamily enzyme YgiQ (UPF0313 family)
MKVLFVNPPVIRSGSSSAKNDFKIEGTILKPEYRRYKGVSLIFSMLKKLGFGKEFRYGVRAGSRWPWTTNVPHHGAPYPFFMGYAAALIQLDGHSVNIIDSVADEEYDYDRFITKVKGETPDLIVLECSTPTIDIDMWLAKKMAEIADVAVAGPHFSTAEIVRDTQADHPYIKYILKGEYIYGVQELVRKLEPGVYETRVVTDLDSIPFPFRNYPAAVKYFDPTMPTRKPQLQIYGSKGCPFKCTFCAWPQLMFQKKVSLRAPEKIAEEIRDAVKLNGYKSIFFDDDTFNMGTDRVSKLCEHLKAIGLPWTWMGRLDISPEWLYDKMVDSGCVGMRFGIETFDHGVLKNVKKGIERKDFRAVLEHITRKHPHLMIHLTMMKDMPGQTVEVHENDMKILKDLGYSVDNPRRSYQLSTCAPFPGTEMYNDLVGEHGKEAMDEFNLYDGGKDTIMKKIKIIKG